MTVFDSPQTESLEEDTKSRLLQAAGEVFADKGFHGATVREICQAAEVNIASVNYYFGDKQRLYIETVKRAHQLRTLRVPLPRWPDGTPAEVKLRDFIRTLLTRMIASEEAPWQHRLMLQEVMQPSQACREMVEAYIRPDHQLLMSILDELLPAEVPLVRRQQFSFSIVGQCMFYKIGAPVAQMLVSEEQFEREFTLDRLADHIADVCLSALGLGASFSERAGETESKDT